MVGSAVNSTGALEELSPVEIYNFASRVNVKPGKFGLAFTRHKTLAEARAHIAIHNKFGKGTIYQFDFDKEEWVEA